MLINKLLEKHQKKYQFDKKNVIDFPVNSHYQINKEGTIKIAVLLLKRIKKVNRYKTIDNSKKININLDDINTYLKDMREKIEREGLVNQLGLINKKLDCYECSEDIFDEEVLLLLEETTAKAIAILSQKDSSYANKAMAILKQDSSGIAEKLKIEKLTLPEPMAKGEKRKPGEKGYYEKWADRENKDENPIDFLKRVWGKYIEADLLYQTNLRGEQHGDNPKQGLDKTLFDRLHEYCKNNGLLLKNFVPNKSHHVNKRITTLSSMIQGKEVKKINVYFE